MPNTHITDYMSTKRRSRHADILTVPVKISACLLLLLQYPIKKGKFTLANGHELVLPNKIAVFYYIFMLLVPYITLTVTNYFFQTSTK